MGEYAEHPTTGRRIKLGTCENLYYVTRADIEALHAAGWRGDGCPLTDYLKRPFRCALPALYDVAGDADTIDARKPDFAHRYRIGIDAETSAMLSDADHLNMYHHANGTNFIIPCPFGKEPATIKTSGLHYCIDLVSEGVGDPRAVYACPYCQSQFNLKGHAAQGIIARQFETQWGCGDSKLPERAFAYLHALVVAGMNEAVPA